MGRIDSIYTPTTWKAKLDRSKCALYDLPGASALLVAIDFMHTKYLGVRQYVLGSMMYLLVNFSLVAAEPEDALVICSKFIKEHQSANQATVRYGFLPVLGVFTFAFQMLVTADSTSVRHVLL